MTEGKELHRKLRPKKLKQVIGQAVTVQALKKFLDSDTLPHAIGLFGPAGCGKTTLARIIARELGSKGSDFVEVNTADFNGIPHIRQIRSEMGLASMGGAAKVYLIDEAHRLTGPAQDALLKMLEDPPEDVYFILATTLPAKLQKTVKTRLSVFNLNAMSSKDLATLLDRSCDVLQIDVPADVKQKIITCSEQSARTCLVLLNTVMNLDRKSDQLEAVEKGNASNDAYTIFRALIGRTTWDQMRRTLSGLGDLNAEAESLRHLVLACAKTALLKGKNPRAAAIINEFQSNFFDSRAAGLVYACYCVLED